MWLKLIFLNSPSKACKFHNEQKLSKNAKTKNLIFAQIAVLKIMDKKLN